MKRKTEEWPIKRLVRERTQISFPEYQREKSLWPEEKKSLLIDSILKDIDIPKLYFNRIGKTQIEVIDGQQRLWSIWEFIDDQFRYDVNKRKRLFSELSPGEREKIENYVFQVTLFQDAEDEYLRQTFVRLQLGLLLESGEKLNAAKGRMKDFVFGPMVDSNFIAEIDIPSRRFSKQTLCAQIAINSFSLVKIQSFSRTRYEDLISFFDLYAEPTGLELRLFNERSTAILATLTKLSRMYKGKTGSLKNRSYILSVYLFVEQVPLKPTEQDHFVSFSLLLLKRLREEAKEGMDRKNRELYTFQSLLSSASGEEYQIRRRHDKLIEYFQHYETTETILGD